jgi:hypothetical protein
VRHERRFVDDASHELRTPISILRASWSWPSLVPATTTRSSPPSSALGETLRLGRLADDLLVLARSRTGERRYPRSVDLGAAASRVARLLAEGRAGRLSPGRPGPGPTDQVEQILLNLVTNAKRCASAGDRHGASFRAGRELTVADDGPGFPRSMVPVTFGGSCAPTPRGCVTGGTGLGLSIMTARPVAGRRSRRQRIAPEARGCGSCSRATGPTPPSPSPRSPAPTWPHRRPDPRSAVDPHHLPVTRSVGFSVISGDRFEEDRSVSGEQGVEAAPGPACAGRRRCRPVADDGLGTGPAHDAAQHER